MKVSEAKRLAVTCRSLVGPGTVGVRWIIAGAVRRSTGPSRNTLAVQVPMVSFGGVEGEDGIPCVPPSEVPTSVCNLMDGSSKMEVVVMMAVVVY